MMSIDSLASELHALVRRHYPPFVYSDGIGKSDGLQYLPVFCFHTLEPVDFESKLRFLEANRYQTVNLDEAIEWIQGERPLPDRAVVLTIDDGRYSTWSVGFPLLKKYGMVATSFVIPGYLDEGEVRRTLDDVNGSADDLSRISLPERRDQQTFLTWSEVEVMHDSGILQIESHTMLHRRVCVSPSLKGFVAPDYDGPPYEIPIELESRERTSSQDMSNRWGMPVFEHLPLMRASRAYLVPEAITERCLDWVREHGGEAFFQQRNWRRQLTSCIESAGQFHPQFADVMETQRWELAESKASLEQRLTGKKVRHLCFPLGSANNVAVEQSDDLGYVSNSWGLLNAANTNRVGSDPRFLGRLKHDFIYRLPGDGRRSLARIMRQKLRRRLAGDTGY